MYVVVVVFLTRSLELWLEHSKSAGNELFFGIYLAKKIRQNSIITRNSQGWNLKSGFLAFKGPSGQGSNFKNPAILASQTLTYGPFSGPSLKGRRSTFGVEFLWFPSYDSHLDNFGIFKTTHREKYISYIKQRGQNCEFNQLFVYIIYFSFLTETLMLWAECILAAGRLIFSPPNKCWFQTGFFDLQCNIGLPAKS